MALPSIARSADSEGQAGRCQDARDLQGEWQAAEFQNTHWIFQGDELIEVIFGSGTIQRESRRKFIVNPFKSPKEIDISITWLDQEEPRDQIVRGIYSLDRRRLTICTNPEDKRPTDFKTIGKDGNSLIVYQRVDSDPIATLEFAKIQTHFNRAKVAHFEAMQKAETAEEHRQIKAEIAPKPAVFAEHYLRLAEANPDEFVGLIALCWCVLNAPASQSGVRALAILQAERAVRADLSELNRAIQAAETPYSKRSKSLASTVFASVKRQLDHRNAAQLLTWICTNCIREESPEAPSAFTDAADLIVGQFPDSPDIFNFCECFGRGGSSPMWADKFEKHLRTILDQNTHRMVRIRASFALAAIAQSAGEARQREAEGLYQKLLADFKEQPKDNADGVEPELLRRAEIEIEEIRSRGLGKPVPELIGEDLAGRPMRLSDFRGKVVLLSFWATWCGPCMRMIPYEKALVKRLQDKPFAVVGVNGDEEAEELRKGIEKYEITWRSFKNEQADKTVISDEWNISGWPTVYLIDHRGTIRKRWIDSVSPEVLDREIDLLVAGAAELSGGR
jgi:uncharacterized protein (TIGR03067 family)